MNSKPVAVVTGANKGIGFAIVRGLCKQFQGDIFLTARNEELGQKAVAELKIEGLSPKFHQLDLNDNNSIKKLEVFLRSEYGGLDILVNNAGISSKSHDVQKLSAPFPKQVEVLLNTNFIGTLGVCEALFPLLKPHARVVNVSSMKSESSLKECSADVRSKFTDNNLTIDALKELMSQYQRATQAGDHELQGFSSSGYGTSKLGVTCMTLIQQKELETDSRPDIIVNSCCPGYVATDMTFHKGTKTTEQGADTPLYLALLPPNTTSPKGEFVSDRKVIAWN